MSRLGKKASLFSCLSIASLLNQGVVAGRPVENVLPRSADEHVVAGAADQNIVPGAADQDVVAVAAVFRKLTRAGSQPRRVHDAIPRKHAYDQLILSRIGTGHVHAG